MGYYSWETFNEKIPLWEFLCLSLLRGNITLEL